MLVVVEVNSTLLAIRGVVEGCAEANNQNRDALSVEIRDISAEVIRPGRRSVRIGVHHRPAPLLDRERLGRPIGVHP